MRVLALLFIGITLGISFSNTFNNGESTVCIISEIQALLNLKKVPSNRLSSWTSEGDCCKCAGVVCDNSTGHVLELHLRNPAFIGRLGTVAEWKAALQREQLGGIQISKFLGYLESLTHLNLSKAGFGGVVPPQLGNLSNFQYLNLKVSLGRLTMLEDLWLSHNELDGVVSEAHFENLTKLRILYLFDNLISAEVKFPMTLEIVPWKLLQERFRNLRWLRLIQRIEGNDVIETKKPIGDQRIEEVLEKIKNSKRCKINVRYRRNIAEFTIPQM
ncbi:hypothetical protein U1Q18_004556 [Sarracenia purpurea var. burkii]